MRMLSVVLVTSGLGGCTLGPGSIGPVERGACFAPPSAPASDLVDRAAILDDLKHRTPTLVDHRSVAGGDMGAAFSTPADDATLTLVETGVLVCTPTDDGAIIHLVRPAESTSAEDPFVAPESFGWSSAVRMIAAEVIDPPGAPIGTFVLARSAGGRSIEDAMGRLLAAEGWRVVLTDRPTTAATTEIAHRDLAPFEAGLVTGYVINAAIEDVACLVLALEETETPRPLVLAGLSQGAMQVPGAAAVAGHVVDVLIVVLGGGSMDAVLQHSRYVGFAGRTRQLVRDDAYRQGFAASIRLDPLESAPCVQAGQVLMVRAAFDAAIPASTQTALWQAFGRPPRWLHLGGHYGAFLAWRGTLLPVMRHVTEQARRAAPGIDP